ncbi:MAG: ABC transporter ATP-binding protein/permease [Rickettsiales bacterium]|jgi:subfamily B ATP-binding cassette protein MsbA|nr:ABC transporter ATP-binding protein/permease [Rickettsiales bacterium]
MKGSVGTRKKRSLPLRIARECVYPHLARLLGAALFMLLSAVCVAYRAYLIKPAVDKIFFSGNLGALYAIPIRLILTALLYCLSTYLESLIMTDTSTRILADLRIRLFSKLLHRDLDFYQRQSPGRIGQFLADAGGVGELINLVLNSFLLQFFTVVALLGVMIYHNPVLAVVSLLAFPLVVLPLVSLGKRTKDLASLSMEKFTDAVSSMVESFNNIKVIQSNCREEDEAARASLMLESVRKTSISLAKRSLMVSPLMEMVSMVAFALIILYSGSSIIDGHLSAGDFFTFVTAMFSVYKPIKSLTGLNTQLQGALAAAERYFTLLDQENMVLEATNPIPLGNVKGDIEFDRVSFHYPNSSVSRGIYDAGNYHSMLPEHQALDDLTLTMAAGKSYALVGPSGSGKSTIFNLMLRFYDVSSGSIRVDGVDLRDLSLRNLRSSISMVGQDIRLFDGSILENIRYAKKDATLEDVRAVAEMANVDEFVRNMPNGYDTIVGYDGTLLSGGQRQRLSIARAFLKNTPILLLDEATSALDPLSEDLIRKSLGILMEGKTTVIIAHRLATIVNCDHIFVLERGRLMEEGSHEELISLRGVYKSFCDKQFYSRK